MPSTFSPGIIVTPPAIPALLAACMAAALTAFYSWRLIYKTFNGTPHDRQHYEQAHESPPVVLIPLAALIIRPWELGFDGFWKEIAAPRVLAALKLSFGASAIAALVNSVFGLILGIEIEARLHHDRIVNVVDITRYLRHDPVGEIATAFMSAASCPLSIVDIC